jgi:predicted HicB family RNase H-like nuclease
MLPTTLEEHTMPETVVHFQIRIPPDLHEKLASWAKGDRVSLNARVVDTLQKALTTHQSDNKTSKRPVSQEK